MSTTGQAEIERLEAATDAFEEIITTENDMVEVPNVGPTPSLKKRVETGLNNMDFGPVMYMQSANSDVDEYGYPLRTLYKNGDGMTVYYPEYSVFRKTKNVWERLDPHSRNVITLNGVSQYLVFPEISIGAEVSLTVKPLSGGNTGLPSNCPLLVDGEIQTVEFILTEAMSELGRNGSSYFHGIPLGMIVDGVNYRFDEGWRGYSNQVLINHATDLGGELFDPTDMVVTPPATYDPNSKTFTAYRDGDTGTGWCTYQNGLINGVTYLVKHVGDTPYGQTGLNMRDGAGQVKLNVQDFETTSVFTLENSFIRYTRSLSSEPYEAPFKVNTIRQADGYGEYVGLTEASWTKETVNA